MEDKKQALDVPPQNYIHHKRLFWMWSSLDVFIKHRGQCEMDISYALFRFANDWEWTTRQSTHCKEYVSSAISRSEFLHNDDL